MAQTTRGVRVSARALRQGAGQAVLVPNRQNRKHAACSSQSVQSPTRQPYSQPHQHWCTGVAGSGLAVAGSDPFSDHPHTPLTLRQSAPPPSTVLSLVCFLPPGLTTPPTLSRLACAPPATTHFPSLSYQRLVAPFDCPSLSPVIISHISSHRDPSLVPSLVLL